jgi:hypothetical protein
MHLKQMMDEPMEPSPAMMLGTLGHAMVLEPNKPLPKVVVYPDKYPKKDGTMEKWNNNAGFCRDWVKAQKASGYTPVTQKTLDEACGASKALSRHELARPILKDCRTEVTLVTMDATNDIAVRCRRIANSVTPSTSASGVAMRGRQDTTFKLHFICSFGTRL